MVFLSILGPMFIMAVISVIGYVIARTNEITAESKQLLISIMINVAIPCIILDGAFKTKVGKELMSQLIIIFIFSIIISLLSLLLGWVFARIFNYSPSNARKMAFIAGLGNTGFIGIPLCAAIFGPKGALLAAAFDTGVGIVLFTVAIALLQDNYQFTFASLKQLINPPIISIVIALFVIVAEIQPPEVIQQLNGMLANLATPLGMLYIGILIRMMLKQRGTMSISRLTVPILLKLIIFPILTIVVVVFTNFSMMMKQVIIIQVAMPTMTIAPVLLARYTQDEEIGVKAAVYSTICAILTVPFIVFLGSEIF
ncbi:AEC family transporter [Peribacillus frigoritolerans]|uniref:AEC family transporter n=1 Tax=Peribacillus frigoritolerans TaxID=450367 RepID=UPI0024173DBC|nr:AEC family transporter [Peribacillus frigoritolerans]MDG4850168.1 AEC family transporter [Peribacillus frigoritolerans]